MGDERLPPDAVALLEQLIPPVDVDGAWGDLGRRLERDRRRRRAVRVTTAIAAACLVVAVVGVAFAARRPADPVLDVTGPTEGSSGETEAVIPTVLEVSCSNGVGTVNPSVVVAGPAGVTFAPVQGDGEVTAVEPAGDLSASLRSGPPPDLAELAAPPAQPGVAPGAPPWSTVFDLPPGTLELRCGSPGASSRTDPLIATVEVVDPAGYYTPEPADSSETSCPSPHQEQYESADEGVAAVLAWRFGEAVALVGYRDGQVSHVVGPGVTGEVFGGTAGAASLGLLVCEDQHPLPSGDGLDDAASVRTDAEALAWLDAELAGPSSHVALPADATVTGRTAKLVRQDEGGFEAQIMSHPPGFSGWLVRADYRDAAGIDRVAVFRFSPSGDAASLFRLGNNPDPPGVEWAAWFDALPDHAP